MLKLGLLLGCVGLLGGSVSNNTIQSDIARKNASFSGDTNQVVYNLNDFTMEWVESMVSNLVELGYIDSSHTLSVSGSAVISYDNTEHTYTGYNNVYSRSGKIHFDIDNSSVVGGITIDSDSQIVYTGQGHTEPITAIELTINGSTFYDIAVSVNDYINMPSAQDLFAQITAGVTGFVGSLGQAFTSVVALFWDSTNSAPTFIGLLMLLAIGAGLIYLAIRFVMGLVRRLRG